MEKIKINLYEEFADKQVVDGLIKEIKKVITTQNNLIDKLAIFEDNFNKLNAEVVKIKLRVDLIDKFMQDSLISKLKIKPIHKK